MVGLIRLRDSLFIAVIAAVMLLVTSAPSPSVDYLSAEKISAENVVISFGKDESNRYSPISYSIFTDFEDIKQPQYTAVFVPITGGTVQLSVNGETLGGGSLMRQRGPGLGREFLYADIPPTLFRPGPNRIDIILENDPGRTGVGDIFFGSSDRLDSGSENIKKWLKMVQWLGWAAAIIGLVSSLTGLYVARRKWPYLGGLIVSLNVAYYTFGLDDLTGLSGYSIVTYMSVILCFIGTLFVFYKAKDQTFQLRYVYSGFALAGVIGAFTALWLIFFPTQLDTSYFLVNQANMATYPLLIGGLPLSLESDINIFNQELVQARREIEIKNRVIAEQEQALQTKIHEKAVLEERQRFTRDMHDGIGGQLNSLLLRVRTGKADIKTIEQDIQAGLTDLRLVVDSLDNVGEDMPTALAIFRARAENQIDAAGLKLDWQQTTDFKNLQFDTRKILHLYRFLQESLSNILRHARAQNIVIGFYEKDNQYEVRISDDGQGFNADEIKPGKGLKSLKERAEKLGALFLFQSSPGKGTEISLSIPYEPKSDGFAEATKQE